jgi:hypothetical protein
MTDWRKLYKATVLETSPTQLARLTKETQDAIFRRLEELAGSSNSAGERREIEEALAARFQLKVDKLRLPDTRQP